MTTAWEARCPDIECEGCAEAIKRSLSSIPGVEYVTVGVQDKMVSVRYDDTKVSDTAIRDRLTRAGFPPE